MSAGEGGVGSVPPEVLEWIDRYGRVRLDGSAPELARGAIQALREALARPGRVREAAYALLAADGLLTQAVEAGLEDEDPETAFHAILTLLGQEAERGDE
ncbi:MAG: hypothetical protein EXR92_03910 [Gemmatimonadetes bacterium]|nr:hypothetical protein [Gemmatimonadota bacterium]